MLTTVDYETTILFPAASVFFILIVLAGLVMAALWLWSLIDALLIDDRRWVAVGQSKVVWVLVIVLLGLLGSILYAVIARPALTRGAPA